MVGTLADIAALLNTVGGGVKYLHIFNHHEGYPETYGTFKVNLPSQWLSPINIKFKKQSCEFKERMQLDRRHGEYFPYTVTFFVPKFRWEVDEVWETLRVKKKFSVVYGDNNCKFHFIKDAKIKWSRKTNRKLSQPEGYNVTLYGAHSRPVPEIVMDAQVNYWADPSGDYYEDNNTGLNWIAL